MLMLYSIAVIISAVIMAKLLSSFCFFDFIDERKKRLGAIDGLRGYLALFVFIHHLAITWYWKVNGVWEKPPEKIFSQMGKVGVGLFFMITGYLFIHKVLYSPDKIQWVKYFRGRIFRIYPLYIFTTFLIITTTLFISGSQMSSISDFAYNFYRWMIFRNAYIGSTSLGDLVAGVTWTLKYEWTFYCCLPFISYLIYKGGKIGTLSLVIILVIFAKLGFHIYDIYFSASAFFIIGGGCAWLAPKLSIKIKQIVRSSLFSIIMVLCLAFSLIHQKEYDLVHLAYLSVFFFGIVVGNDIFGLLATKFSVVLGEISYSIYLLHGFILYMLFTVIPFDIYGFSSFRDYMLSGLIISPVIVVFSTFTFLNVEKRYMHGFKK